MIGLNCQQLTEAHNTTVVTNARRSLALFHTNKTQKNYLSKLTFQILAESEVKGFSGLEHDGFGQLRFKR